MSDASTILQESFESQEMDYKFEKESWVMVTDSNGLSYSGSQLNYDLSVVCNGSFVDWDNSFLQVPLQLSVVPVGNIMSPVTNHDNFCASLKQNLLLVNSIYVSVANCDVVQHANYSGIACNYKLLSTYSNDKLQTFGSACGFYKDNSLFAYNTSGESLGIGECNNCIQLNQVFASNEAYTNYIDNNVNLGRVSRVMQEGGLDGNGNAGSNATYAKQTLQDYVVASQSGQNGANAATPDSVVYNLICNIPLGQMHDFFNKLPLVRGAFVRMQINLNTECACQVTVNGGGTAYAIYTPQTLHTVLPYQISPIGTGAQGMILGTPANAVLNTSLKIGNASLNQTRIWVRQVQLAPEAEKMYLSKLPQKKVCYDEVFSYRFNVGVNSSFNQLITPSITRLRGMLIVPVIGSNAHVSSSAGGVYASPLSSPFSSAGATTIMNHQITNFNVMLGGQQWYPQNINYTWQQFLYETDRTGAYGGRQELTSGLISYSDYVNGMGFVYVDLQAGADEASDAKSKSVLIQGICNTATPVASVDYFVYLFYEKQIDINCSTGEIVFRRD